MEEPSERPDMTVPGILDGPIPPVLGRLSLPVFAGMVLHVLYGVVDTLWVSRIDPGDPSYVGGVGIIFPLIFLVIAVGSGIMIGASTTVARAIGAGDRKTLDSAVGSGLVIGVGAGILLLVIGYALTRRIVTVLGAKGDTFTHALHYFRAMLPAGFLMLSGNTLIGVLQGEGRMDAVMKAVVIGTVANIVLDPLYIFVFRLGVRGAGFATITAQLAAGSYVVSLFMRRHTTAPLRVSPAAVNRRILVRILSVGFPQTLGQLAMSVKFLVLNRIVVGIGEGALAAFTICGRFDQMLVLPILAISSAEIAMVGQNFGQGNFIRMRKIRGTCLLVACAVTAGLGGLLFAAAPDLFSLFTDVDAVAEFAVRQTRIVVFSYLFTVWPIVGKAYFQALGRPVPGLAADIVRLAVVPVSAALFLVHVAGSGVEGVWFALVAGNVSGMLVLLPWLIM